MSLMLLLVVKSVSWSGGCEPVAVAFGEFLVAGDSSFDAADVYGAGAEGVGDGADGQVLVGSQSSEVVSIPCECVDGSVMPRT